MGRQDLCISDVEGFGALSVFFFPVCSMAAVIFGSFILRRNSHGSVCVIIICTTLKLIERNLDYNRVFLTTSFQFKFHLLFFFLEYWTKGLSCLWFSQIVAISSIVSLKNSQFVF